MALSSVLPARRVVVALVVAGLLALAGCGDDSDGAAGEGKTKTSTTTTTGVSAAPQLSDPAATATELITTWLTTLQSGKSVADLMAPNFQIQRADGTAADRDEYLANPAKVDEFSLGDTVIAAQSGNTLSVRWSILVSEVIDGVEYTDVEAPRLTVFEWTGASWQIVGYANFNELPDRQS